MEELYISFNELENLFDISFLEHLSVLDMEGNNIHSLDQLCYLRPLTKLTDVNFKQNPIRSSDPKAYQNLIKMNCPNLVCLDDQPFEAVD